MARKKLGAAVRGDMTLKGTSRSQNGAVFLVLEDAAGETYPVPVDAMLGYLRPVFGTRRLELRETTYYGRPVYHLEDQ